MLSRLKHSNLPAFTDFFAEGSRYFLVMEFIDGSTLEDLLEANKGPFSEQRVLDWTRQLCNVLEYLHSQQPSIIFRDMKPGNVMLTQSGRIKLIDFGIARISRYNSAQDTQLLGTPGFAPPEQYGSAQTDERSDIYSLAMTLCQLLTDSINDTGFGLKNVHFNYPHISPPVARVLEKATSLKPEDRYESVATFRRALLGIGTFRFENGGEATTPDELAELCSHRHEEAADYLFAGEIESWLQELGKEKMAQAAKHLRVTMSDPEAAVEKLINELLDASISAPSDEGFIYFEPGDGWTDIRERLKTTPVKSIILVVSTRLPLRNLAGWKLLSNDMHSLGKKITVISSDLQIRALAQSAGLEVVASLKALQQRQVYQSRKKISLRKIHSPKAPEAMPIRRARRSSFPPQPPLSSKKKEIDKVLQQNQPIIESQNSTVSFFSDRDVHTPLSRYIDLKDFSPIFYANKYQIRQKLKFEVIKPYRVFLCYAREDEKLLNQLRKHLKALQRQQYIEPWYDRDINAGSDWKKDIDEHLKIADIILLLVSPDFMASDYCYGVEVEKAMERHNNEEAIVIPIILRHTYWNGALFGDLQALPEDAKPIFGPDYPYPDKAFLEVIRGVLSAIKYLEEKRSLTDEKSFSPHGDTNKTIQNEHHKLHTWGEKETDA